MNKLLILFLLFSCSTIPTKYKVGDCFMESGFHAVLTIKEIRDNKYFYEVSYRGETFIEDMDYEEFENSPNIIGCEI